MIRVNDSFVLKDISYGDYAEEVAAINQGIDNRTLVGSDFLGWAKYPETYDKEEFQRILAAGKRIAFFLFSRVLLNEYLTAIFS